MTDIITFLSKKLGRYKAHPNSEYYFTCPFCHHSKAKFAVNVAKDKWHCWHCGSSGKTIFNLVRVLDLSKSEIDELRELLGNSPKLKIYKENTDKVELRLPAEFKPLWKVNNSIEYKHALAYLRNRNISMVDIIRYRMGYCETGNFAHRIIIPSYDADNKLNYFVARSYFDANMKYKNPTVSKNIICFESFINWNLPVVLCEGVFDAISVRQNAIPLLGKHLPKKLELALLKNKVKTVYVCLDKDAESEAKKLENKLKQYDINVYRVSIATGDAGEIGFTKVWEFIKNSKSTSFKELIENKLSNV